MLPTSSPLLNLFNLTYCIYGSLPYIVSFESFHLELAVFFSHRSQQHLWPYETFSLRSGKETFRGMFYIYVIATYTVRNCMDCIYIWHSYTQQSTQRTLHWIPHFHPFTYSATHGMQGAWFSAGALQDRFHWVSTWSKFSSSQRRQKLFRLFNLLDPGCL